jgi:hypothetical protein
MALLRQQPRYRGFAGPWRSPQHHGMQAPRFNGRAQGFAGTQQMFLPHQRRDMFRAHAIGQRS